MNGAYLAYICNDLDNFFDYNIKEIEENLYHCYFKGNFIGTLKDGDFRLDGDQYVKDVYFTPSKPVTRITINTEIKL
jgi:hypothetical protein